MIEDEAPLFGRAHNQPPGLLPLESAVADIRQMLAETEQTGGKTFAQRKAEFLLSAKSAVVRSRETAGDAADVIKLAGLVWDKIHALRKERTQPYRDAADAIGREAVEFWSEVDEAMLGLRARIDAWGAEEDRRIEAQRIEQEEELERLRRAALPPRGEIDPDLEKENARATAHITGVPAAAHPAYAEPQRQSTFVAPTPARRKPVRGNYGAQILATEEKIYEIEDVKLLPDYVFQSPVVREAIITFVRQTQKHMGVPAGIRVRTAPKNQIR